MSTMRANTLSNIAGTGSPDITGGELSRARYNLNGTGTIAARDSFNIGSFTDNGTGDYTATFSTAMPNADYAFQMTVGDASFQYVPRFITTVTSAALVGSFRSGPGMVTSTGGASTAQDATHYLAAVFGDRP